MNWDPKQAKEGGGGLLLDRHLRIAAMEVYSGKFPYGNAADNGETVGVFVTIETCDGQPLFPNKSKDTSKKDYLSMGSPATWEADTKSNSLISSKDELNKNSKFVSAFLIPLQKNCEQQGGKYAEWFQNLIQDCEENDAMGMDAFVGLEFYGDTQPQKALDGTDKTDDQGRVRHDSIPGKVIALPGEEKPKGSRAGSSRRATKTAAKDEPEMPQEEMEAEVAEALLKLLEGEKGKSAKRNIAKVKLVRAMKGNPAASYIDKFFKDENTLKEYVTVDGNSLSLPE